jgi:hypothetical protein
MGSANQNMTAAKRTAFSEQDQTALYTSANADKSQGRKGLGSRSARVKASAWQGKKVSFDSDQVQIQQHKALPHPAFRAAFLLQFLSSLGLDFIQFACSEPLGTCGKMVQYITFCNCSIRLG